MKWFFISAIVTMSLLVMYYKTDATNDNIEKVVNEQVVLVKKKVQMIQDKSSITLLDEDVHFKKKKTELEIDKNRIIEHNESNDKDDVDDKIVEDEYEEEIYYKIDNTSEIDVGKDTNTHKSDKVPSKKVCRKYGGSVLDDGDCLAQWEASQNICKAMNRKLLTLNQMNQIVEYCKGQIDDGNLQFFKENEENEHYQTCYRNYGFDAYEFWTGTKGNHKNHAFVIRFDIADVYERHELGYAWVRCIKNIKE